MRSKEQQAAALYTCHSTPSSFASRPRVLHVKPTFSNKAKSAGPAVSYLRRVSLYFVFHVFNSVLGVVAFAIVIVGSSASFVLLPLCGFGGIVFQALGMTTERLARIDVAIANLVVEEPNSETRLRVHPGIKVREFAVPHCEPSSVNASTATSSNRTLLKVMLYFATAKLAVSTLSCLLVAFVVSFPIAVFSRSSAPDLKICERECADRPVVFLLVAMGVFLLSNAILVVIAMISRELIEMVCADTQPVEHEHEAQVQVLSGDHQGECMETLDASV